MYERSIQRKKEYTLRKFGRFIQMSRSFMELLSQDDPSRGTTKAFLYDQMIKSLLLVVDEIVESFEKYGKDHISTQT